HVVGNEEGQIWARNQLGYVIVEQGDDDYGAAEEALTAGLALARQTGNRTYIAKLSSNLAMLYDRRGEHDRGLACLDEALAIAQETGSARHQAFALNYRGNLLLNRGDYAGAGDALEQALTLFHAIGYRQGEGKTLSELALLTLILGEPDAARAHAAAARAIAAELGLRRDVAVAYTRTGYIAEHQRAWQAAAEMYAQARHVYTATGQRRRALEPTAGMAHIAWATGAHDAAVRLATELREALDARPPDATCEAQWVALTCAQILPAATGRQSAANGAPNDRQADFTTAHNAFRNAFETLPILS
ncbi:MAG: tetratricopeptide repeat protein, partial [Caldilineaceae bacterium]